MSSRINLVDSVVFGLIAKDMEVPRRIVALVSVLVMNNLAFS